MGHLSMIYVERLYLKFDSNFYSSFKILRVNFHFAPCGLVTLTVLLQTFKNSHFTP
ncbi:hypothetical protein Hanom_Chr09g00768431 [Helianthus anomalus]